MPFTFKQFHVDDSHCGMPVSTDGVLLGAWAPLAQAKTILDIGAGSGLLSLMAAQRSEAAIQALEIDPMAARDCQHNIDQSPWGDRITLTQADLLQWYPGVQTKFDHILCNPPYFDNGPQSQCSKRAQARHTDSLAFDQLLSAIKQLLAPQGKASLILPNASLGRFLPLLADFELQLHSRVDITTAPSKKPQRHLLCLSHAASSAKPSEAIEPEHISIRDASGAYSEAMVALTQAFYLKL
ncbi:tRNA1(Val) (adenine(37)-N6)-methyltransferase [Shewanella aquimarina]|uniref:tRNA1(Val) (adenine(37)-N6)-methyltransferase n=1 Tax=Shewanella aquimarina TaxID=260365 RepID=UPI002014BA9F|nr:methyltransferase [Shewanella aquimarina]MCL2909071.1 methyltransferase [Shewanella aquimarina]